MRLNKMPQEFEDARNVLQTIEDAGYEAYFVGGSVRDTLLDKEIHDVDIATSAYPAEIKQIFQRTVDTGIEHGTVMVLLDQHSYEITTFRTESGYQDFRRPDQVTFVRSLQEDLMRRDFTINALALKEDRTVIDIFDGIADLERKMIRAVGKPEERFHEDALRMMRAVRFASQLDFEIEDKTKAAIAQNSPLLAKIAVERTLVEFEKMMLGQNPKKGLDGMLKTGLNQYCPGLADQQPNLKQLMQYPLQRLENTDQVWLLLISALGLQDVTSFLKKWKTSNDLIKNTRLAFDVLQMKDKDAINRETLFKAGENNVLNAVKVADILGYDAQSWLTAYQSLQIKSNQEMKITGKDLIELQITKPGPQMGKILGVLKELIINDAIQNDPEQLINKAKEIQKVELK